MGGSTKSLICVKWGGHNKVRGLKNLGENDKKQDKYAWK